MSPAIYEVRPRKDKRVVDLIWHKSWSDTQNEITKKIEGYAFVPKSGSRWLAREAQWFFLFGLIFLCAFAVKNFLSLL